MSFVIRICGEILKAEFPSGWPKGRSLNYIIQAAGRAFSPVLFRQCGHLACLLVLLSLSCNSGCDVRFGLLPLFLLIFKSPLR